MTKNEEIILKLIRQQLRLIPIRDIVMVSRKIFGVSDAEGRDYFYIKDDPILLEFFENLKINVKRKEE